MKTKQIIPLTLGLLLAGSLMVQAQDDFRPFNQKEVTENGPVAGQGRGQNFKGAHFANCSELTDEQKATLESLREDHRTEVKKLHMDLEAQKAKQKSLVESANPDTKAIDKNIDEIAKLEAQLAKSDVAFRLEVEKIFPKDCKAGKGMREGQGFGQGKMNGPQGKMDSAKGNNAKGQEHGEGQSTGHGNGQTAVRGNGQHQGQGNGQGFGSGNGQGANRGMAMGGNRNGEGFQGNGMGMHNGMAQGSNARGGMKDSRGGMKSENHGFAGRGNVARQGEGHGMRFTLSDETKDLLQKNMLEVSAQTRDLRNQINELEVKQKALLSEDKVKLNDVNKNIDEIAKLKAQVMKARVNAQVDVLKQLSPDEKEKVLLSKPLLHGQGRGTRI